MKEHAYRIDSVESKFLIKFPTYCALGTSFVQYGIEQRPLYAPHQKRVSHPINMVYCMTCMWLAYVYSNVNFTRGGLRQRHQNDEGRVVSHSVTREHQRFQPDLYFL